MRAGIGAYALSLPASFIYDSWFSPQAHKEASRKRGEKSELSTILADSA